MASKIRESHVFRNTKLKSKGRGNASTFNKLSSISSLHARFSPLCLSCDGAADYVVLPAVTFIHLMVAASTIAANAVRDI